MSRLQQPSILALMAGALLAIMILLNAQLAGLSSPMEASWFAHGLGALTGWCLIHLAKRPSQAGLHGSNNTTPWYAYLGGLPGAFTVILAAITVNSSLALAGTLSLGLLGQILLSLVVDQWALFGAKKRRITPRDTMVIGLILSGALLIIFAKEIS